MKMYRFLYPILIGCAVLPAGCNKYLDKKSQDLLVVISSIQDCQALFDQTSNVNVRDASGGEASADNYFVSDADLANMNLEDRNMYSWHPDNIYPESPSGDWGSSYHVVYLANTVFDNVGKIERNPGNAIEYDDLLGQAHFLRGKSFWQVLTLFAKAYDPATASADAGIPIRLSSRLDEPVVRSSVQASYDQLLSDLKMAAALLPAQSVHVVRPSKAAAYGLLARTYLSMRKYDSCMHYTELALQLKGKLKDFNTVNELVTWPLGPEYSHPEVIYNSRMGTRSLLIVSAAKVDSTLYDSYKIGDLRKSIFFSGTGRSISFKGSFSGGTGLWSGIGIPELVLMKAECAARNNNKEVALEVLNYLLENRWDDGLFSPLVAANAAEALQVVLTERRKELVFTGLRWMDIKRLNKEEAGITIQRKVNGQFLTLAPNDPRYALAIPRDVINLSGIKQNPR